MSILTPGPVHVRALLLFMAHSFVMMTLTVGGLQLALPAIMKDFGIPVTTAVWVVIAYQIALPSSMMALGAVTTLFDRRKLVVLGLVLDVLIMAVSFLTGNIYIFILTRFLSCSARCLPWIILQVVGIGGFPASERGKAVGYNSLSQGLGLLVALPLTGFFVDYIGWRYLFLTSMVLYTLMVPLVYLWLPKLPPAKERPRLRDLDVFGSVLMLTGMICFITAMQLVVRGLGGGIQAISLGIVGVGCLIAFTVVELKVKAPILDLRLFRMPNVSVASSQAMMLGFANGVVLLMLPFMFIDGFNWTAAYASSILLFQTLPRPPAGPLSGRLADRFGSPRVILPAAVVSVCGQFAIASFGASPPLQFVMGVLLFWGAGQAVMQTANLRQIYTALPDERLHLAPTINLVSTSLGTVVGQGLGAFAIERARETSSDGALMASLGDALVVFTIVFGIGVVLAQLLPRFVNRIWPAPVASAAIAGSAVGD
ncbi:MAG: MFS transporter [Dehalococcoidia bacterium]